MSAAVRRHNPLAGPMSGGGSANMLIPQAYDASWTELIQVFNQTLSPGDIAALTGQAGPAANAPGSSSAASVAVSNFPSSPSAPGDRDFRNPVAAAMVAIGPASAGMILGANPKRCALTIQNNSASGGSTFWISFGTPAVQYNCIGLPPGAGIVRDFACPRDAVYIFIDGGPGVAGGLIQEDSYVDTPGASYVPRDVSAEAWGYNVPAAPPPPPAPAPLATLWNPPPAQLRASSTPTGAGLG